MKSGSHCDFQPSLMKPLTLILALIVSASPTSKSQEIAKSHPSSTQLDGLAQKFAHRKAPGPSLHLAPKMKDGVKGFDTWISPELPSAIFSPFDNQRDKQLHAQYCGSDSIVVGTAITSAPHLVRSKSMIVTTTHFKVANVIKSDQNMAVGSAISVIREGGQTNDEGETLRINVVGRPDYKIGSNYLLVLKNSSVAGVYYAPNFNTVRVRSGDLIPSSTISSIYKVGEPLKNYEAQLSRVISKSPCR